MHHLKGHSGCIACSSRHNTRQEHPFESLPPLCSPLVLLSQPLPFLPISLVGPREDVFFAANLSIGTIQVRLLMAFFLWQYDGIVVDEPCGRSEIARGYFWGRCTIYGIGTAKMLLFRRYCLPNLLEHKNVVCTRYNIVSLVVERHQMRKKFAWIVKCTEGLKWC